MDHHSSYTAPRSSRLSGTASHASHASGRSRANRRGSRRRGSSQSEGSFFKTLLCCAVPFVAGNLLLYVLVTASPKLDLTVGESEDYRSVTASFTLHSLLPLKTLNMTLESQNIEFEKDGDTYTTVLTNNGTLEIYAESWNGMPARAVEHVAVLDDAPPSIDQDNVVMDDGELQIYMDDSLSGINYSKLYALDDNDKQVSPLSYDQETGLVIFPLKEGSLDVYVEDLAGNKNQATFSIHTSGIDTSERNSHFPEDGTNGTNGSDASSKKASSEKETKASSKESTKASSKQNS